MTTDFFCSVGGFNCQSLHVYAGQRGAWYYDAILDDAPSNLGGKVTCQIGSLVLQGTVRPSNSGEFILARSLRVVAGAGGWGTPLTRKAYHSDGGVSPALVAQDAARECGEVLGSVDFGDAPLPADYVRRAAEASVVLDRLLEDTGRTWWVDQAGITQIGIRPELAVSVGTYQLDTYSPLQRLASISLDDPAVLWVGSVLTDRLSEPQTIRDIEIHVEKTTCRIHAYTGGDASDSSRLGRALDAILGQRDSQRLFGVYGYRVFTEESDGRLALQALRKVSGLPDVMFASQSAGIATALSSLQDGAIVRVMFDEGDCRKPFVAFYPSGDPDKAAGIVRMSDLMQTGGYGTTATFSLLPCEPGGIPGPPTVALGSPTGTVPVLALGLPYLVSFGNTFDVVPTGVLPPACPPVPLDADLVGSLYGYALSASDQRIE